jgi:UDP:flavonoid glycosyltransferase YjiC (YdhE family)
MDHKPVLLIFPFDLLAHYLRCLELAEQLRSHFTIYFQHSNQYHSFVTNAGFPTFSCRTLDAQEVLKKIKRFDFSWINEEALEPVLQDQVKIIDRYQPQAVLGDNSPTLKMAAEKTKTFYISLINGSMTRYYAKTRKLSPTHPLYKYLKDLPPKILDRLTDIGERTKFQQIHRPFKRLRRRYDLPAQRSYQDELEGNLNLICDLPELFPQKSLPDHYEWVPPLYHQKKAQNKTDWHRILNKNKKTIFVTMGSSGSWEHLSFLNDNFSGQYNVVTAGNTTGAEIKNSIPYNFVHVDELFPYTDLVICHGGNGTIYQALAHGIPVLCLTSHIEQEWNAQALEDAGLGIWLNGKSHKAVLRLIDEWCRKKGQEPHLAFESIMHQKNSHDARVLNVIQTTLQNGFPGGSA